MWVLAPHKQNDGGGQNRRSWMDVRTQEGDASLEGSAGLLEEGSRGYNGL